jgi:hypothetical protein
VGLPLTNGTARVAGTQLTMRDCQFFNNEQVLVWTGDTAAIEDCWVEGHGVYNSSGKALFENYAKLMLSRMLGVPGVVHGKDQRCVHHQSDRVAGLAAAYSCSS